jgi:hypothetical protein
MAVIDEILNGHVMLHRKLLEAKRMLIDKQFQSLTTPDENFAIFSACVSALSVSVPLQPSAYNFPCRGEAHVRFIYLKKQPGERLPGRYEQENSLMDDRDAIWTTVSTVGVCEQSANSALVEI